MSTFLTDLRVHRDPEDDLYVLDAPLKYQSAIMRILNPAEAFEDGVITVPALHFHTDLATIPRVLQWLWKPDGPWRRAAVVHDYLLRHRQPLGIRRVVCDSVFLEAMEADDIDWFTRHVFWVFVRLNSLFKGD